MVRASPSAIPARMYRHFALVTVLLTTGIAMFAEGENREATAPRLENGSDEPAPQPEATSEPARRAAGTPARRPSTGGFDGGGMAFGMPMDKALGSVTAPVTGVGWEEEPGGYSERYLASLGADERDRLLKGLEDEGMLSPEERERKSAALVSASHSRSGGTAENH